MGYYTAYNLEVENYDKATGKRSAPVAPDVFKQFDFVISHGSAYARKPDVTTYIKE